MSTIICNGRISTQSKYVEIIGVPELSLEPLEREYSDGDLQSIASISGPANSTAATEYRKISQAEGCFVAKRPGFHLAKAYLVKPVRKNSRLKLVVEDLLENLNIVPKGFLLDAPSNLIPLDRNLHYTLDKLGFFAVTCLKATLLSLITLVDRENQIWQARKGVYTRYFNWDEPPFTDAMYELVVLHPRHFLPKKGNALIVFTEHGDELSGKRSVLSPDGSLREGPENYKPQLPAFSSNRARAPEHVLNPFLVAINVEIAFRRHRRRPYPYPLCAEYIELMDLTMDLVDKIYFQPILDDIAWKNAEARQCFAAPGDKAMIPKALRKRSRMGTVIEPPGSGASRDETIEYYQYLMSG